jgi:hypothetical protein
MPLATNPRALVCSPISLGGECIACADVKPGALVNTAATAVNQTIFWLLGSTLNHSAGAFLALFSVV